MRSAAACASRGAAATCASAMRPGLPHPGMACQPGAPTRQHLSAAPVCQHLCIWGRMPVAPAAPPFPLRLHGCYAQGLALGCAARRPQHWRPQQTCSACTAGPLRLPHRPAAAAVVSSLSSFEDELPFDYYSMPFCKPAEGVKRVTNQANIGTVIMGLVFHNSVYNFTMMVRGGTAGRRTVGAGVGCSCTTDGVGAGRGAVQQARQGMEGGLGQEPGA